ncbi:MAG: porin [Verrucomicrobiota bacterium]
MTQLHCIRKSFAAIGVVAVFGAVASAGEYAPAPKAVVSDKAPLEADPWTFCDIFDANTLYEGDGFIREISLHGRYHGQYISQNEEIGGVPNNGYHNWHHRRTRFAVQVEMQGNLTFYAEGNFPDGTGSRTDFIREGDEILNDFQDFYLEWEPEDTFLTFIKVGKQKQKLTREDWESSKRIKAVERAAVVNEVAGARPWGATIGFETGPLLHEFGGWIYGEHREEPNWIDFQANTGFSYHLEVPVSDDMSVFFDYVYVNNNDGFGRAQGQADNGTVGSAYEHSFALGAEYEKGRFQLMTDFVYALNRTSSGGIPAGDDTWGFYVIPSYDITDDLEFVFRYAYLDSGREQRVQRFGVDSTDFDLNARQSVEDYHTVYAGLQYFICGEKLKLMAGYEWASGKVFGTDTDIDTGGWQLAVRTYF